MSHWLDNHSEAFKKAGFDLEHEGEHTTHIKEKGKRVGTIQNTLSHIPHYDVEGVSSKQLADYLAKSGAKAGKASEGSYRLPKSSQHTETPPQTYLDFLKAGGKPHEYRG